METEAPSIGDPYRPVLNANAPKIKNTEGFRESIVDFLLCATSEHPPRRRRKNRKNRKKSAGGSISFLCRKVPLLLFVF